MKARIFEDGDDEENEDDLARHSPLREVFAPLQSRPMLPGIPDFARPAALDYLRGI